MFQVGESTYKKRWFGYQNETMTGSASAILVYWDTSLSGDQKTAHIYATNETLTGSIEVLLEFVNKRCDENHYLLTGNAPPKNIQLSERKGDFITFRFFTNAWICETEVRTTKSVIDANKHKSLKNIKAYINGLALWEEKKATRKKGNKLAHISKSEKQFLCNETAA
ncbi:hypothetical protein [Vibrio anguillarum]|uniref:hypothetical protein n=1 Tax=Vibrio anguillarum TaxID=55601 RepID=UPI00097E3C07|nr:hypothetical protein [Vibrio anguillarum]AQM21464.1 hypothetical protein PN51_16820 [Vibrio anguillarum]AUB86168.1 hypothetical protein CKY00_02320 [Vibrio anguillarum]AUB89606.1 hypothetical protein CKX99_02320 [Vibrio anguillarum]AUB93048.1 hypothetical protein CK210_02320 [Vibrio anguillarum]AUB96480.1 hypothetical protein CK209_02320 [Vibrio anguillarum]